MIVSKKSVNHHLAESCNNRMPAPFFFHKHSMLHPEVYQAQLMQRFVQGKFLERGENVSPFYRAQVISIDNDGGRLENPNGAGSNRSRNPENGEYYEINASIGPANPPRSIRARLVSDHDDAGADDSDLGVYWPMMAQAGLDPVPLEFVYVFFEGDEKHHGLWVTKIAGPLGENVNFSPGSDPYVEYAKNNGGKRSLAAAHGNAPPQQTQYSNQESIVGSKPERANLSNLEYK